MKRPAFLVQSSLSLKQVMVTKEPTSLHPGKSSRVHELMAVVLPGFPVQGLGFPRELEYSFTVVCSVNGSHFMVSILDLQTTCPYLSKQHTLFAT